MATINYEPDSLHMAVRARMNIGYTGPAIDSVMAEFADTVNSDYESNNFDPEDADSYIGDGNTYLMTEQTLTTRELIGEIWDNGRWDDVEDTLEGIVSTAVEEVACEVVRVMAELLIEADDD